MAHVPGLPDDVWGVIFSKLEYNDRIRIMGVCRQWRDCGYADTSTSLIWQLNYGSLSAPDRSVPLNEHEGKETQLGGHLPARVQVHHQSRIAFIRRRWSTLRLISIGSIPADKSILRGILGAIGVCEELLALDIQVGGMFKDHTVLFPLKGSVLLPNLSYLRTNLPFGSLSAFVDGTSVRYADVDADFAEFEVPRLSATTALTLHQVRPDNVREIEWLHLSSIQLLDLHYKQPPRDWEDEVIQDLIEYVLPQLNDIEELRLHLPHLDCPVWQPLKKANLKSVSLSCQDCECQIEDLLYWPQLEDLHIANLDCFGLAIGSEDGGLSRKKMFVKTLVINKFDGLVIIDPESLVGQYASLQHLELSCEEIEVSEVEDPRALVPLEGQCCNLMLRTAFKLKSELQDSLLSLGFTSIPSNPSPEQPNILKMQHGAHERAFPLQPVRSRLYDAFHRGISTSFARNSEEYTLLASKEYRAFLETIPWSLCYTD